MHFRFEINLIANEIAGPRPGIRILDIAWSDKQRHVRRYLVDYHRCHRVLPSGLQDLGSTQENHLRIGVIDFDAIRVRIDAQLRRQEHRNLHRLNPLDWYEWYCVIRDNLLAAITGFYDSHLSLRYYWRGQWFTRAWWHYHHK